MTKKQVINNLSNSIQQIPQSTINVTRQKHSTYYYNIQNNLLVYKQKLIDGLNTYLNNCILSSQARQCQQPKDV